MARKNGTTVKRPWRMIISLLVAGVIFVVPTVWLAVVALTLKGEAYVLIFVAGSTGFVSIVCLGYGLGGLFSKYPQHYIYMDQTR